MRAHDNCSISVSVQVEEARNGDDLRLTITCPPSRCQETRDGVLQQMRKDVKVPGFRNNEKASEQAIIRAYGGNEAFKMACVEEVIHEAMREVRHVCANSSAAS